MLPSTNPIPSRVKHTWRSTFILSLYGGPSLIQSITYNGSQLDQHFVSIMWVLPLFNLSYQQNWLQGWLWKLFIRLRERFTLKRLGMITSHMPKKIRHVSDPNLAHLHSYLTNYYVKTDLSTIWTAKQSWLLVGLPQPKCTPKTDSWCSILVWALLEGPLQDTSIDPPPTNAWGKEMSYLHPVSVNHV